MPVMKIDFPILSSMPCLGLDLSYSDLHDGFSFQFFVQFEPASRRRGYLAAAGPPYSDSNIDLL
jgi:hypothetical protein